MPSSYAYPPSAPPAGMRNTPSNLAQRSARRRYVQVCGKTSSPGLNLEGTQGVKVDLALPASYTSTAGGFFATASVIGWVA